ncbi:hypothetical protein IGI04_026657 [Brassica rapa subsp. trilocularis]|uniref:Uncharacterized protein n=1 Tax=Brassica rapa subsp. trilocularis TaxID=1813537 RepID=A0ABQ7KZA1_BRACM|nr:hypothetical protein IGI04_026657 [Brassica rapa subsp. trilocularis]
MEETKRSDGFSRDDTEEFNEVWIHGRVITGMKHNSPMYFVFDLCYVYTTQPCRLHNSVIPQTYPKIRKCLDNSTVSFR